MIDGFTFKFSTPAPMKDGKVKIDPHPALDAIDKKLPVCIDLGSAVGGFLLHHADKFDRIYCVEANFPNFITTLKTIEENNFNHCTAFNLAACSKNGKIRKISWFDDWDPYSNSIVGEHIPARIDDFNLKNMNKLGVLRYEVESPEEIANLIKSKSVSHSVLTISLEGIFELLNIDRINYLKLDIEGSEFNFLHKKDLRRVDIISLEIHYDLLGESPSKQLLKYIKRCDFSIYHELMGKRKRGGLITFINNKRIKISDLGKLVWI